MPRYSPTVNLLFALARPLSPLYGLLMRLRASLYLKGIFRQHHLPVPVISVGNLTVGGTGKTPLVQYIARFLQANSLRPAIVSRGYGGRLGKPVNVISDGQNIFHDAAQCGDEPRLLAETLPSIPVLTGKNRFATASFALQHFSADAIVLDDGFQHLGLARDLDLVLFHADTLLGKARVLPGGELREPEAALKRGHCFIITGVNESNRLQAASFKKHLENRYPNRPVFTAPHAVVPHLFKGLKGSIRTESLEEVAPLPVFGFCGIASPDSFKQTLKENNFNLVGFKSFNDHHIYSEGDIRSLLEHARQAGARALITTEKDFVKLKEHLSADFPIYVLQIELAPEKGFDLYLADRIKK